MAKFDDQQKNVTKHLFGVDIGCHVRLCYYAHDYPQNQPSRPCIDHAVYKEGILV